MKYLFFIGLITIALLFPVEMGYATLKIESNKFDAPNVKNPQKKDLLMMFKSLNMPFPENFVRICVYESGHQFESSIARNYINLCGMEYPRIRKTTASGYVDIEVGHKIVNGASVPIIVRFATYDSYWDFAIDMKYWVDAAPPDKDEDFFHFIKRRGFNTINPDYCNYLAQIQL